MKAINPQRLQGRFALVTGASRGIGRAVAKRFAAEGATVAINHYQDGENADASLRLVAETSLAHGHGDRNHLLIEADVAAVDDVRRQFANLVQKWGRVDIVVNNAGIQAPSPSEQFDLAEFHRILSVNLLGAAYVSSTAAKHFIDAGIKGAIVNTSSVHEIIPKPTFLAYSISKGGLGNLTRTMALEFAAKGIRVNAVAPGAVVTDINRAWIGDPLKRRDVEKHIPMGRAAEPDEIAPLFAFLASDEASYVTGQTFFACGGLTLYADFMENWAS
jgi:glucose 1-dehydrogenase